MTNKKEIQKEIDELELELENKEYELDSYDDEGAYCECLDEGGSIKIAGIDFEASDILRELDPIAYRCGLNDFEDEGRSKLEDEIDELKDDIKRLWEDFRESEAE